MIGYTDIYLLDVDELSIRMNMSTLKRSMSMRMASVSQKFTRHKVVKEGKKTIDLCCVVVHVSVRSKWVMSGVCVWGGVIVCLWGYVCVYEGGRW